MRREMRREMGLSRGVMRLLRPMQRLGERVLQWAIVESG